MSINNNPYDFLNTPALDAMRKLQETGALTAALKMETTGEFAEIRELQSTLNAVKSSMDGDTATLEEYRKVVAPILESVKEINTAYAPIFEQTKAFDALNIKGIISGLQTSASAMSAIFGLNLSKIASIVDALPKYNFLSDIVSDNFTIADVEELYENGKITQDDINEEISEIVSKKQFSPKAEWDKLKKSKWFLAIKILIILVTFVCKPVTEYITDKAIDELGINEYWEDSGVYDLIDSIFGENEDSAVSEMEAKKTVDKTKTGNVSKYRREDLLAKIKEIRTFISAAPQDENTGNLLSYLSDLEKDVNGKKYGLVFEEHREEIDEVLDTHTPVLTEEKDLLIDNGGQMNFLIEGDNLASLKLLEKTHKGKIDLIYIDPPYNTGAANWIYDNDYVDGNDLFKHSKWLSMMQSRLEIAKRLLTPKGVLICAIDENESATLRLLLDNIFGTDYEYDCITIIHNPRGIQGKNFSYTNEFAYFVIPKGDKIICERKLSRDEVYWSPLRNWGSESLRSDARNCFYPIIVDGEKIVGFGDVSPENYHPKKNVVLEDGKIAIYPIDSKGVERKWRYARQTVESINQYLAVKKTREIYDIEIGKTFGTYKTVWSDPKYDANGYGKQLLNSLLPNCEFDFPKSLWNVYDCLYSVVAQNINACILDFFAGSGTTGHAVMKLNEEDNGNRHFILCTNNENNICRDVTYERIKRVIDKEGYTASLKYYKIDYVPISDCMYYEYADELLKHIRELVELENGVNFTGNAEIGIVLTEEELDEFIANTDSFVKCRKLCMGHDVLPTDEQEKKLQAHDIEISIIPDYYYRDLQED